MVTTGVILGSLVKVHLVLMEFMEVRHARARLRRLSDLLLLLTAGTLLGTYLVGMTRLAT